MANNEVNFNDGISELNDEMLESVVGGTGTSNAQISKPTNGGYEASNPYGHPRDLISTDMQKDINQLNKLKLQDKKLELQMQGLRNDIQQDKMALNKLH